MGINRIYIISFIPQSKSDSPDADRNEAQGLAQALRANMVCPSGTEKGPAYRDSETKLAVSL
jgi:hypothetical protein